MEELEKTPLDKPEEILRNIVSIANHKLIEVAATDVKLEGWEDPRWWQRHDHSEHFVFLPMRRRLSSINAEKIVRYPRTILVEEMVV